MVPRLACLVMHKYKLQCKLITDLCCGYARIEQWIIWKSIKTHAIMN